MTDPLDRFIKDTRSPLAKLLGQSPVAHRVIVGFEGAGGRFKGASLALVAISGDAHARSVADGANHLVSVGFDRADLYTEIGHALFDAECKVQLLSRSLRDGSDPSKPFAESAGELRKALESDEVAALFEHYLDYQEERSPFAKARSWEEVEGLIDAMGKGLTPPTSLNSYDSASLRFMLRELAYRYVAQTKPPSLDTSHVSDSSV